MSFEIARNIAGGHTLTGGPAGDGVWFGALPAADLPDVFLSRVLVAGSFSRVLFRDADGITTMRDYTTEAGAVAGDIPWPNSTSPVSDRLQLEVPAGKVLKGIMMRLSRAANWTDQNLDWALSYPGASALVSVAHAAASTPATVLRTGAVGDLLHIQLAASLTTDNITPVPIGIGDAYWRRVDVGLTGTITGSTTYPLISRIWPVWEEAAANVYTDYTGVLQPMTNPNYASWPDQIVVRAGDETLFGCIEWPFAVRMIIDRSSGTSGAATYRYSTAEGLKDLPAEYVNDPSDFGRAAPGTYQLRFARPADAAKMWALTYTHLHGGVTETHTVFSVSEPALPDGATQVRKLQTYLIGRRYSVDHTTLVNAFQLRLECRALDPAQMTSTLAISAADSLKATAVEAEYATDVTGESAWFLVNRRTGEGILLRGTLTQASTAMSSTATLARQANDGFLLAKLRDKTGTGAEAASGELVLAG